MQVIRKYLLFIFGAFFIVTILSAKVPGADFKLALSGWIDESLDEFFYEYSNTDKFKINSNVSASSEFKVGINNNRILFYKKDCMNYREKLFLVHVYPARVKVLEKPGSSYKNLDFKANSLTVVDDSCFILKKLPLFPIEKIVVGQYDPLIGQIWSKTIIIKSRKLER